MNLNDFFCKPENCDLQARLGLINPYEDCPNIKDYLDGNKRRTYCGLRWQDYKARQSRQDVGSDYQSAK